MLQEELYSSLQELGIPVAYNNFSETQKPPYLVYFFINNNDLIADDYNFKSVDSFQIELYTNNKDLELEGILEGKLKELRLPYSKYEQYIDEEKLLQVVYRLTII